MIMDLDLEKFRGKPPYASEIYGVFQPLIGWKSRLIRNRLDLGAATLPSVPHVVAVQYRGNRELVVTVADEQVAVINADGVFSNAGGADMFRPRPELITFQTPDYLDSLIVRFLQGEARAQLVDHAVDDTAFWRDFWIANLSPGALNAALRQTVELISGPPVFEMLLPPEQSNPLLDYVQRTRLEFSDREQAATYLFDKEVYVTRFLNSLLPPPGADPAVAGFPAKVNELLLNVVAPLDLKTVLEMLDPFHLAHGFGRDAVLSPVGLINLYRQFYFDFQSFLGAPVEHVWLSPGSTTELIEVSTRRVLQEHVLEQLAESVSRTETAETAQDELSQAIKEENQRNVKLGSSVSGGATVLVAHADASASMSVEETQRRAREETHRTTRQQSAKLSTEIRNQVQSTFRTVTETTDTRSKRYTIENKTDKLVNYELRRKMRQVGVQQQDLGTQLCWQTYVDDPGVQLGVGQLVHLAAKSDLSQYNHQQLKPEPQAHTDTATILLPVPNPGDHSNLGPIAAAASAGFAIGSVPGAVVGVGVEVVLDSLFGGKDKSDYYDIGTQSTIHQAYKVPLPAGYQVAPVAQQQPDELFEIEPPGDIPIRKIGNNGRNLKHRMNILNAAEGTFDLIVYGGSVTPGEIVQYQAKITVVPTADTMAAVSAENKGIAEANKDKDIERARKIREEFVTTVQDRVKLASEVRPRLSDDLREEERTVVYRNLIEKLMREAWSLSADRSVAHLRSELIKSIFDVDKLLYFVAPEWWQPRVHESSQQTGAGRPPADSGVAPQQVSLNKSSKVALAAGAAVSGLANAAVARARLGTLGTEDLVGWGGEGRPDNYLITEDSKAAPLGSSLGWLLQLDGDNLRNAFLNAPWVKAVLPIRPGKEQAALEWLKQSQVEGTDGLDELYAGDDRELFKAKYTAKYHVDKNVTVGDVLELLADEVTAKADAGMEVVKEQVTVDAAHTRDVYYLRPDRVFEKGFDPLVGGFLATPEVIDGKPQFEVYTQWVEILPTDQIVAVEVEYDPKTGFLK
jgi:hypothetical protein